MLFFFLAFLLVVPEGYANIIGRCSNNPCQNGGTCYLEGDSYRCLCTIGWQGKNCQNIIQAIQIPPTRPNSCPYEECPGASSKLCQSKTGNLPDGNYAWPGHPNGFMTCINGKATACQCCPSGLVWVSVCNECHRKNDPSLCTAVITTKKPNALCTFTFFVSPHQDPPATTTVDIRLRQQNTMKQKFGSTTFNAGDERSFTIHYDPKNGEPDGADIYFQTLQVELCIDKVLVTLSDGTTYIVEEQSNRKPGPHYKGYWIGKIDQVYVPPPIGQQFYKCVFFTGSQPTAGTNANVYVILVGENGRSAPMKLSVSQNNKIPFQAGQFDDFNKTLPDIGEICSIEIWHDGTGTSPDWFVESVFIMSGNDLTLRVFPIDRWVTRNRFMGQIRMGIECDGCANTKGFCDSLPDGDYTYPNEKYKYISCSGGKALLRDCAKPCVWLQTAFNRGHCGWSE